MPPDRNSGNVGRPSEHEPATVFVPTIEQKLVLSLLSAPRADGQRNLDGSAVDWNHLRRLTPYKIQPFLASRLDHDWGRVPSEIADWLAEAHRASAFVAVQQRAHLRRVLAELATREIPSILLKGAALAYTVYPDPALRPMSDVDLWVPIARLDEAAQALVGVGFRFPGEYLRGGRQLPQWAVRSLDVAGTPFHLELHGRIRSLEPLMPERVELCWQRSQAISIGDVPARMMHPEDLILHVGLHLARTDRFARGLLALLDLRLAMQRWRTEVDWHQVAADYREQGVHIWMGLAFSLARELLAAPVPSDVLPPEVRRGSDWTEVKSLAVEQLWESTRLFGALDRSLQSGTTAGAFKSMYRRLVSHYFHAEPGERRSARQVVRDAVDRLSTDLTVRLPNYAGALRSGSLRGSRLKRNLELARRRGRLGMLVERLEHDTGARGAV